MTLEQAAAAMYAAYDHLQACTKGTDDYVDARVDYANATADYSAIIAGRTGDYVKTMNGYEVKR